LIIKSTTTQCAKLRHLAAAYHAILKSSPDIDVDSVILLAHYQARPLIIAMVLDSIGGTLIFTVSHNDIFSNYKYVSIGP